MRYSEVQPLTAKNLSHPHFQKQDNRLVQEYLRSQKSRLRTLAPFKETVDLPSLTINTKAALPGTGFSSPVLRPRAERNEHNVERNPAVTTKHNANRYDKVCHEKVQRVHNNDVDDRSSRLEARRSKREVRRKIMKEKSPEAEKQTSKQDVPDLVNCFELGLLGKFTAPNIKNGRLTLKPKTVPGFFSKGKSSIGVRTSEPGVRGLPTNIHHKKTSNRQSTKEIAIALSPVPNRLAVPESERKQNMSESTETRDVLIQEEYSCRPSTSKSAVEDRVTIGVKPSSPMALQAQERSDVWDIELDRSLPSDAPSIHCVSKTADKPLLRNLELSNAPTPEQQESNPHEMHANLGEVISCLQAYAPNESAAKRPFDSDTFCWMPYPPRQVSQMHKGVYSDWGDYVECHWPHEQPFTNLGINQDADMVEDDHVQFNNGALIASPIAAFIDLDDQDEIDGPNSSRLLSRPSEWDYYERYDNPWSEFGIENNDENLMLDAEQNSYVYGACSDDIEDAIGFNTRSDFEVDINQRREVTQSSSPLHMEFITDWNFGPKESSLLDTCSDTLWSPEEELKKILRNHWQPQKY